MKSTLIQKIKSKLTKKGFETLKDANEYKWFHEKFTREESETFLSKQNVGVFVIRKSETIQNAFVLSVKVPIYVNNCQVSHYVIIQSKNRVYMRGFQEKEFSDIQSLLTHCSYVRDMLPVQLDLDFYDTNMNRKGCVRSSSLNSVASADFLDLDELNISQASNIFD
ncbi:unnamed protein product [Brachionus calyciflorus]|uniref:SH2 domain-containing protein n=1 Tax=Brachionus calyciflorus TaxID=104777 RepID=A0A813ZLC0_9BILA|nr:unnamed protein product [Brachionus calyciflorus]